MKVMIFDTETSGIPLYQEPSDDPRQPYVVELAADLIDLDTREIITSLDFLIDNDVDIPEDVVAIHGARVTGDKWENQVPTFCTMSGAHAHVKKLPRKPEGWAWPPTLADAHLHIVGESFTEAHRARPDCDATRRLYFNIRSN